MNTSSVAFTEAPAFDAPRVDSLGAQFDAAIQDVRAADAQIAAAEALRTRRLARVAELAEQMSRADGSAATAAGREWAHRRLVVEVACATKRSERTTARLIDDAEHLVTELPLTLARLSTGAISYAHAKSLVAHAMTVPAEARASFERDVLPHAEALPAHRFDDRARRLRERLHPESIVTRTRAALEERYVSVTPECDGMATILHHLPAVDALAIDDLIDRVARAARSDDDGRTHAQRRCDALTDLVLARGDRPSLVPTVLVTIAATTLAGADDAPASLHGYGPIAPDTARRLAHLAPTLLRAAAPAPTRAAAPTGGPRPSRSPSPATSATTVTRHRTRTLLAGAMNATSSSSPTSAPRPAPAADDAADRYSASPVTRTVLALLDETCRFPGCGRRADRCELDHTHAWSEGGRTTPDNLAHLCSRHHHLKHEGGWRVTPSRDGTRTLHWTSPRGAPYTTTPELHSLTAEPPDPPPH
ncbi:DUF222 domain-containing protein [Herbiconiux sp. VKM Ac-1786]|uniref:HNH endonuclease signature motif containing protein n=1 Tax=Herbiconiux sp. VKM Ac-1786 TaxID=2783824 RepID=UPI00188D762F|nr:HNH endonuclease signature motif containing protein [Herbiconiux sp. VKM Ac-1786]MBF4573783.1 DUF222 domain-containing protein [Herbiconiux sp. VKM Ac-1786]